MFSLVALYSTFKFFDPVINIAQTKKIVSLTCFECMDEPAQCAQGTDDEDDTERANNESYCA